MSTAPRTGACGEGLPAGDIDGDAAEESPPDSDEIKVLKKMILDHIKCVLLK
ncbi:MAG: hypothetical protein HZB21_04165 [Deltaproteobacteria bacterium]|nr:hypothetical protein [Deltaproteobacteria bacterium]MBI5810366.1 hypothetical protein [Deltaproteobacteria bacterium]